LNLIYNLFLLITLNLSFTTIVLSLVLLKKRPNKSVKQVLIIFSISTLSVCMLYLCVSPYFNKPDIHSFLAWLSLFVIVIIAYLSPSLFNDSSPFSTVNKVVGIVTGVTIHFALIIMGLSIIQPLLFSEFYTLSKVIFIVGFIVEQLYLIITRLYTKRFLNNKAKTKYKSKIIKILNIINGLCLILFIRDIFVILDYIQSPTEIFPLILFPIYHLTQCLFGLYHVLNYLFFREIVTASNYALTEKLSSYELTEREVDIVSLVISGLKNKDIGSSLYISPETVKKHLNQIYKKLNVETRFKLINKLSE